jgi:(S)-citramalyl-CoA lyase
MAVHRSRRSILSLKSWLFTPATKADRFGRAAEVHADALIIDLEDAVTSRTSRRLALLLFNILSSPPKAP